MMDHDSEDNSGGHRFFVRDALMSLRLNNQLPQTAVAIQDGIVRRLHRGVQLFVSIDGNVVADGAIGEAQAGELLTSEHRMLLLSAGKPLIAIAIAQLVERSVLNWDDVVTTHIPEFACGGKSTITIRHLLTHTGGFRNIETGWPDTSWSQMIARICESPIEPNWIPGQRAGYHLASSWFVLGEIVRRIDGRSFDDYLRQEICQPLELGSIWNGMPKELVQELGSQIAPMFVSEAGSDLRQWELSDPRIATVCAPGGNTRGTARDLGRFYEALLDIRRGEPSLVLKSESVAELTRPQRVGKFDETFQHVIDFGLGFVLNSQKYGPATVPYGFGPVASDDSFGHGGSQSSIAFADPDRGLVVVIVCNGRPGEGRHQRRMRGILTALENDLVQYLPATSVRLPRD